MASILVVSGPQEGEYYPIGKKTIAIGRDEGCLIQIVDELVSRKHVQIRYAEKSEKYLVHDFDSANGTFLNDRRVTDDEELADGDVVRIGNSELLFSSQNFTDRETAFDHYRSAGQRGKSTIIKPKQ